MRDAQGLTMVRSHKHTQGETAPGLRDAFPSSIKVSLCGFYDYWWLILTVLGVHCSPGFSGLSFVGPARLTQLISLISPLPDTPYTLYLANSLSQPPMAIPHIWTLTLFQLSFLTSHFSFIAFLGGNSSAIIACMMLPEGILDDRQLFSLVSTKLSACFNFQITLGTSQPAGQPRTSSDVKFADVTVLPLELLLWLAKVIVRCMKV